MEEQAIPGSSDVGGHGIAHHPGIQGATEVDLAEIWDRYRDAIEEQVRSVEHAIECLRAGDLTVEVRRRAETEAHKLAGAVGTFGYALASEVAREIENLLKGSGSIAHDARSRLVVLAPELRSALGFATD